MDGITYCRVVDGNIEPCRDLCNELMVFQKSKAHIAPQIFDGMNFDTRLKPSYDKAQDNLVVIVYDNDTPVAYVFASIESTLGGDKSEIPQWAPKTEGEALGFYPEWAPERVGILNHLYIREKYRGMGIGRKLMDMAMDWIWGFSDIDVTFVYISNGNKDALDFYLQYTFNISHEVFGGFITAAYNRRGGGTPPPGKVEHNEQFTRTGTGKRTGKRS